MKKFISGMIIGAALASSIAFAASYIAEPASFKVMVNGNEFVSDPPAMVIEGSTYLPLRAMGNALGVPVEWNAELGQAEVGNSSNELSNDDSGYVFSQLTYSVNALNMWSGAVDIANNTGHDISGAGFKAVFYDAGGYRVGTADLLISNGLLNGETKTATFFTTDDLSSAVEVKYQVDYEY